MAQRGGKRAGAGRPHKAKIPQAVPQKRAQAILDFLALPDNPHDPKTPDAKKCNCQFCRIRRISDSNDPRMRWTVERDLLRWTIGVPSKIAAEPDKSEPGKPGSNMKVIVEFIGRDLDDDDTLRRDQDSPAAEATEAVGPVGRKRRD